jgi:hypothetical protein
MQQFAQQGHVLILFVVADTALGEGIADTRFAALAAL